MPTAPAVRTDVDFEIVPAGGTRATYRKKRRLRHVAVFGQLTNKSILAYFRWGCRR